MALQETVLRAALLAGIVTATMQVVPGLHSASGIMYLTGAGAVDPPAVITGVAVQEGLPASPMVAAEPAEVSAPPIVAAAPVSGLASIPWDRVLLTTWLLGAAIGLAQAAGSAMTLRRLLRGRRFLPVGRWLRSAASALGLRRRRPADRPIRP